MQSKYHQKNIKSYHTFKKRSITCRLQSFFVNWVLFYIIYQNYLRFMLCSALYRTGEYFNEFTYIFVLFEAISLTNIQIKVLQGQPCIKQMESGENKNVLNKCHCNHSLFSIWEKLARKKSGLWLLIIYLLILLITSVTKRVPLTCS